MRIVLVTTGSRPALLEQTLRSMRTNAADFSRHHVMVVYDGDRDAYEELIRRVPLVDGHHIGLTGRLSGVGAAKNAGAGFFAKGAGDGEPTDHDILMFSDDDMWYGPGWDTQLEEPFKHTTGHAPHGPTQLGGWRHPYHALGKSVMWVGGVAVSGDDLGVPARVYEVDAVTGNCFVMRWADWLKYGPFDSNAIGPGQSEDYALSQRIRAGGGLVATLDPPVAIHCGLVNSVGEPATGWRECEEQITEQLAGLSAEMRNDILIMRPTPNAAKMRQMGFENAKATQFSGLYVGPDTVLPDGRTVAEAGLQPGPIVASQYMPGKSLLQGTFEEARKRLNMHPRDHSLDVLKRYRDGEATIDDVMDVCPPTPFAAQRLRRLHAVNIGSGQRRFESVPAVYWQNVDLVSRPPDQVPDIVGDARNLDTLFVPDSQDYVVSHHLHEHLGHGEADPITRAAYNVLRAGGSLLVFTPDARKLAGRWLGGELDDFQFAVQMMGAYQGEESDRHKWIYTQQTLEQSLANAAPWREVKPFDWRTIPGADLARDFYIAAVECVK